MKIVLKLDQDLLVGSQSVEQIVRSTFAHITNKIRIAEINSKSNGIIDINYELQGGVTENDDIRKLIEDAVALRSYLKLLELQAPAPQALLNLEAIPLIATAQDGRKCYSPQVYFLECLARNNDYRQQLINTPNILSVTLQAIAVGPNTVNFTGAIGTRTGAGPVAAQYSKLAEIVENDSGLRQKCLEETIVAMDFIVFPNGRSTINIREKPPVPVMGMNPAN